VREKYFHIHSINRVRVRVLVSVFLGPKIGIFFFPGVNSNKFANYWKIFQNFQCHEVGKKNPWFVFLKVYLLFSALLRIILFNMRIFWGGVLAAKKIHWVMLVNTCSKMIITDNN
jgi:hypothetical protein